MCENNPFIDMDSLETANGQIELFDKTKTLYPYIIANDNTGVSFYKV